MIRYTVHVCTYMYLWMHCVPGVLSVCLRIRVDRRDIAMGQMCSLCTSSTVI